MSYDFVAKGHNKYRIPLQEGQFSAFDHKHAFEVVRFECLLLFMRDPRCTEPFVYSCQIRGRLSWTSRRLILQPDTPQPC